MRCRHSSLAEISVPDWSCTWFIHFFEPANGYRTERFRRSSGMNGISLPSEALFNHACRLQALEELSRDGAGVQQKRPPEPVKKNCLKLTTNSIVLPEAPLWLCIVLRLLRVPCFASSFFARKNSLRFQPSGILPLSPRET
jgi:hypothetical protein